ncbi:hypothetical protein [Pseudooctadecabacter sp.]|uniref:hypothetical protein n=1 Tax=Pseudooctadecabacter sp. TaxID=1966338 RepID=UPI0025F0DAFB|nr:hypothetical protein [Pseudooctadecabacter sp.]
MKLRHPPAPTRLRLGFCATALSLCVAGAATGQTSGSTVYFCKTLERCDTSLSDCTPTPPELVQITLPPVMEDPALLSYSGVRFTLPFVGLDAGGRTYAVTEGPFDVALTQYRELADVGFDLMIAIEGVENAYVTECPMFEVQP